jgi:hypothetical protein
VNVNLDGTLAPGRNGMGTGSGLGFVPNAALVKIYAFYRNAVRWLQPANRVWCSLFWDLVAVRYHPYVLEELVDVSRLVSWRELVGLGRSAEQLLGLAIGPQALEEMIAGMLLSDKESEAVGDLLGRVNVPRDEEIDRKEIVHGLTGGLLVKLTELLPVTDQKEATKNLEAGVEKSVRQLVPETRRLLTLAAASHTESAQRTLKVFERPIFRRQ